MSKDRVLGILDLFTIACPQWTAEELGPYLPVSRATLFRHLKVLVEAGLLASVGGGGYRLGPRFLVADRQIRLSDPLLLQGTPVMEDLLEEVGGVVLLCTHFRDQVLCIHQLTADPDIKNPTMERGLPVALFRGAPSRTILSCLSQAEQRRLMRTYPDEIREAGLGSDWETFRDRLAAIRADGYYVGRGELDPLLVGICAPVVPAGGRVAGALCMVRLATKFREKDLPRLADEVMKAAAELSARLGTSDQPGGLSPLPEVCAVLPQSLPI